MCEHLQRMRCCNFGKDVATIDESLKHITDASTAVRYRYPESGYSVLHSAVECERPVQVICKLLKLGADPLANNTAGQTPADLVRAEGKALIAQLLDRAAQDVQRPTTAGNTATPSRPALTRLYVHMYLVVSSDYVSHICTKAAMNSCHRHSGS